MSTKKYSNYMWCILSWLLHWQEIHHRILEGILSPRRERKKVLPNTMQKLNTDLWLWSLVNLCGLNNSFKSLNFAKLSRWNCIAFSLVLHERFKHIEINCPFIREKLLSKELRTGFINSDDQLANILTKYLREPRIQFIGAFNVYVSTWGQVKIMIVMVL